jgi:hypothetical protein
VKSVCVNVNKVIDALGFEKICVIPYNGKAYKLKEMNIVFGENQGIDLELVDKSGNVVLSDVDKCTQDVVSITDFENLPSELTSLELRGKIKFFGYSTLIECVEFVM